MLELIKEIRKETGAGVMDIKKALSEAGGDKEAALKILQQKGAEKAEKKGNRETKEGAIGFYLHNNGKVGAMIKIYCETDFVARNEEFVGLTKDLAMQVAAMNPESVDSKDGSENALLYQPFIKNPEKKVKEVVNEQIAKMGENIVVGEFARFEL